MAGKGEPNSQELKVQGLIDRYLHFRSSNMNFDGGEPHLDEDLLTAFVEGRLSRRESPSILKHLIHCSFCLHVTGELARLNFAFADEEAAVSNPASEPIKVSEVLSGLLSRIFGAGEGAVFAHHEEKEDESENTETPHKKDS